MEYKKWGHLAKYLQEKKRLPSMHKKLIILSVIGLIVMGVHAQDTLLTKEDAIALALENNYGINVAKNQVEVAKNNKSVLNSGYLPTLTGSANANYSRDDSVIEFPGQFNEDGSPRGDLELNQAEAQRYSSSLKA